MLRLGAGELMPLILNEDDVHALWPAASPCSGWVKDSTNSPPWARCEAPGRAHCPPRPPLPPEDAPSGSRPGRSAKATPSAPLLGGTSALPAEGRAGAGREVPGGCPHALRKRPKWGISTPCSVETLFHPHLREDRHLRSPLAKSMSSVLRCGGLAGASSHACPARRHDRPLGGETEPAPAGSARSAQRGRSPCRGRLWARK